MNWKDILKDMALLVEIENIMNKPIPNIRVIGVSLVKFQRSYPNIFRTNENLTDLRGMVNQMVDEAEQHYHRTRQLEVLRIKEMLLGISDKLGRIEELE